MESNPAGNCSYKAVESASFCKLHIWTKGENETTPETNSDESKAKCQNESAINTFSMNDKSNNELPVPDFEYDDEINSLEVEG